MIREAARYALKGKLLLVTLAAAAYMLCLSLPVIIVEQITGLWGFLERAADEYIVLLANDPNPASIYEWAGSISTEGQGTFSFATILFLLLVPGPLTLGMSIIWLRLLRGQKVFADMVFSGFGNFARSFLLNFLRTLLMALWAILFLIPGVIAYYRYSFAFFLLADNPQMSPIMAINLSKYYMRGNKASRFFLDLSFLGWFILAMIVLVFASSIALDIIAAETYTTSLFMSQLVISIIGSFILAPLSAYRGLSAAEYYHRVICQKPDSFKDPLLLPGV